MSRLTTVLLLSTCAALPQFAQGETGSGQTRTAQAASPSGVSSQALPSQIAPPAPNSPAQAPPANAATADFSFDNYPQFSAMMSGGIASSGDFTGHVYRSGNLMRMEGTAPKGNYFLTDLQMQETHGFASSGCIDFDYPYSRSFPFVLSGADKKYEIVPVAKEKVDGHMCRVEDVTISSPKLKQSFIVRVWRAEDLQGFPIKIENRRPGARQWSIHYTDVVLGPQDRSLFLIPNKCESFGLPDKSDNSSAPESGNDSDKKDEQNKNQPQPDGNPQ